MATTVGDKAGNSTKDTIYEDLPLESGQIRLLTILPKEDSEKDDSPLRCTLKTALLANQPSGGYTALSYTWSNDKDERYKEGDNKKKFDLIIEVNGRKFKVTRNLKNALEHFRNTQHPLPTLWVDAISINQNHDGEKGEQVQLMQSIFSGAKETWAWLGIEDDESTKAVDLINDLSHVYRQSLKEGGTSPEFANKNCWGSLKSRGLEDKLIAFDDLLSRDYWYRVWIVQEIALSKNLIFFCGPRKFFWASLLFTAYLLNSQIETKIMYSWSHKRNPYRGVLGGIQRILSIQSVRHDFQENLIVEMRDSLLSLLSNHRSTGATEAKDKYIALAGLAKEDNEDYWTKMVRVVFTSQSKCDQDKTMDNLYDVSKKVGDVYILACESITKEELRHLPLDFLDSAEPPRKEKMPSWVPDWSITQHRASPLLYFQLATKKHKDLIPINAPGRSPISYWQFLTKKLTNLALLSAVGYIRTVHQPAFFIHREQGLLLSKGRKVDMIKEINIVHSVQNPPIIHSEDQTPQNFAQHEGPKYPTNEHPADVLWKTLVLNRTRTDGRKAPENWGDIFYNYLGSPQTSNPSFLMQWWDQSKHLRFCGTTLEEIANERQASTLEQIPNQDEELAHFKTAFTVAVGYRKLATTEKGYLGLVPLQAKDGDLVVVLADCSAPVLLRRRESKEAGYEFIGTCYVHGIMHGEAMEGLDMEERISDEFNIL